MGNYHIGDKVIWKWTVGITDDPTVLTIIDESISKHSYDYKVQSPNTGNIFYEREEDLYVVQCAKRESQS